MNTSNLFLETYRSMNMCKIDKVSRTLIDNKL